MISAVATWAEGSMALLVVGLGGSAFGRERRAAARRRQERLESEPRKVSGWVCLPVHRRGWRVTGLVQNGSRSAVWDVHACLVDETGHPLGTPVLVTDVLAPEAAWPLSWTMGIKAAPYYGVGIPGPPFELPLPMPRIVTNPLARFGVLLTFTDASGARWRRLGPDFGLATGAERTPTPAERSLSRAIELIALGSEAAARACLEESLDVAASLRLSRATDTAAIKRLDVVQRLVDPAGSWVMSPGYTDATASAALATVAGALHRIDGGPKNSDPNDEDSTRGRSLAVTVDTLADAVSAIHTALNGVQPPQ